jgi:glycine cleavage system aminomethyltransferase T
LTALNLAERGLPDGSCAQTHLAKCHAIVARRDVSGLLAYRIFVMRDVGEFVWDALMEAGRGRGLAPIGTEAWRALGG